MPELFASMFPDSKVTADCLMKDRKLSYVIAHRTGYFFAHKLVKNVFKAQSYSFSMKPLLMKYGNNLIYTSGTGANVSRIL